MAAISLDRVRKRRLTVAHGLNPSDFAIFGVQRGFACYKPAARPRRNAVLRFAYVACRYRVAPVLHAGALCGRGGTGRRAGFRFPCRKTWGFKSLRPHHGSPGDRTASTDGVARFHNHERRGRRRPRTMQVTETVSDGLKREFQITVPAADLAARLAGRLSELKDRVQLKGFRPGKVPVTHLRKVYGRSVMAETIEGVIREFNAKIVEERGFKLAMEPKVTIPNQETEVERVIAGQSDLAYTLALEVLPKIEFGDFKSIKLERLNAEVTTEEIEEALAKVAEQNTPYSPKEAGAKVGKGDRVIVDFTGTIDGVPFEGGTGGDVGVNVGSGTFIPGFEDQLIGMAAGETRTVNVTFPDNYANAQLAGKSAEFQVTAKTLDAPGTVTIDDAFAKTLGVDSLDKLKELVKERVAREHGAMSRQKLKRSLLDQLDEMHKFEPPPTLVEDEFNNVW